MTNTIAPISAHDWISKLPRVLESRPVKVTIGKEVYSNACLYKQENDAPEGCANPGKYVREMLYIVGFLPKCEDRKVCYTVEGDHREWYLVGGVYGIKKADRRKPKPANEFNPFGNCFMLGPWDDSQFQESYKGEKIDHYEAKPYLRVALKIEG